MGCLCSLPKDGERRRLNEDDDPQCLYSLASGALRMGASYVPRNLSVMRFVCDTRVPALLLAREVRIAEQTLTSPNGDIKVEWVLPTRSCAKLISERPGGNKATETSPADFSRIMLYMHGGAYVLCQPGSLRGCTSPIARSMGAALCVPDYRRPPEHPIAAAIDDGLAVYRHLVNMYPDAEIYIGGESAGGGLAASMLGALRFMDLPVPRASLLMSPWTDLGGEEETAGLRHCSVGEHTARDYIPADLVAWIAKKARGTLDGDKVPASPMYMEGTLATLPPTLVLYGKAEVLCGQIEHFCDLWNGKGAKIQRHGVIGGLHAPLLFNFCHGNSYAALDAVREFFDGLANV